MKNRFVILVLIASLIFISGYNLKASGQNENTSTETTDTNEADDRDEWTKEDIKDYILEAYAITDEFNRGCDNTPKIIATFDNCEIYECTCEYSYEDFLIDAKKYFTADMIDAVLHQYYLYVVDGKVGLIGASGENRYWISEDSEICFVLDEENKKIVGMSAFNDSDDIKTLTYTLEMHNDRWLITSIVGAGYPEDLELDKIKPYDDAKADNQ